MSDGAVTVGPPTDNAHSGAPFRWCPFPVMLVGVVALIAAGLLLLAWAGVVPSHAFAGPNPQYGFLFPLGFALLWVVVLVVVRPWRRWGPGRWGWAITPDAEEVVRLRFARGEISRNEMDQLLHDLAEHPAPRPGGGL